ncbi:MAG: phage replisome organizer N-terminal domain-containing protein [Clostridia bacterium]
MANDFNNKKYYWIKLKDNFMTSETVDFLMSQKNGANYVVLYQMLCLKTINTNGELARQIGEIIIPFDVEKITRDCKWFDIDTIRIALGLYQKLGLVYLQDSGILKISNFDSLIGSETQSNLYKKQSKNELENFQPNSNKRLDIRDKIIDNKILDIKNKNDRGEQVADSQAEKSKKFIKPTAEEVQAFCLENNYNVDANRFVNFYESKGWLVGKTKMKDWKAALRGWESRNNPTSKPTPKKTKWDDRVD